MLNPEINLETLRRTKDAGRLLHYYKGGEGIFAFAKGIFADAVGQAVQAAAAEGLGAGPILCSASCDEKTIVFSHGQLAAPFFEYSSPWEGFVLLEEICELLCLALPEELLDIFTAAVQRLGLAGFLAQGGQQMFSFCLCYCGMFTLPEVFAGGGRVGAPAGKGDEEEQAQLKKYKDIAEKYTQGISPKSGENPEYANCMLRIALLHCGQQKLIELLAEILYGEGKEVNFVNKTSEVISLAFASRGQQTGQWESTLITITPFGGNITVFCNIGGKSKTCFKMPPPLQYIMQCLPNSI